MVPGMLLKWMRIYANLLLSNVGGIDGEFIKSVVKLKDDLLMILNSEKIFEN